VKGEAQVGVVDRPFSLSPFPFSLLAAALLGVLAASAAGAQEFSTLIRSEYDRWRTVVQQAGVKIDD